MAPEPLDDFIDRVPILRQPSPCLEVGVVAPVLRDGGLHRFEHRLEVFVGEWKPDQSSPPLPFPRGVSTFVRGQVHDPFSFFEFPWNVAALIGDPQGDEAQRPMTHALRRCAFRCCASDAVPTLRLRRCASDAALTALRFRLRVPPQAFRCCAALQIGVPQFVQHLLGMTPGRR